MAAAARGAGGGPGGRHRGNDLGILVARRPVAGILRGRPIEAARPAGRQARESHQGSSRSWTRRRLGPKRTDPLGSLQGREISEISTAGGTPITAVTAEADETRVYWPSVLPDGRLWYLGFRADGTGALKLAEQGRAPRLLMPVNSNAAWVDPGYLLFAREGSLLAQRFDLSQGRPVGETHSIADTLSYTYMPPRAMFSASRSGTVVYQSHRDTTRLVLIDRTGHEVNTSGISLGTTLCGRHRTESRSDGCRRFPVRHERALGR